MGQSQSPFQYLKTMTKDKYVASIFPTSRYGVQKICEKMDFSECRVVVEYGPATGVVTTALLERMPLDSTLYLIERNPDFVNYLQKNLTDSRAVILQESAENVEQVLEKNGVSKADYVISGIPFSFFPPELRDQIIGRTHWSLAPGGKFIAYQMFFQKDKYLKAHLETYFQTVHDHYELRNVPPIRLYEAVK